jgi:hypothetical protein
MAGLLWNAGVPMTPAFLFIAQALQQGGLWKCLLRQSAFRMRCARTAHSKRVRRLEMARPLDARRACAMQMHPIPDFSMRRLPPTL